MFSTQTFSRTSKPTGPGRETRGSVLRFALSGQSWNFRGLCTTGFFVTLRTWVVSQTTISISIGQGAHREKVGIIEYLGFVITPRFAVGLFNILTGVSTEIGKDSGKARTGAPSALLCSALSKRW
jgi:hypothetical protein